MARDWEVSDKEAQETLDRWYSDRPEVRAFQEVRPTMGDLRSC